MCKSCWITTKLILLLILLKSWMRKRKEIPNFQYDASTRMTMRNSLTMSKEEV